MHYLYILISKDSGRYYIGETSNLEERLKKHIDKQTSFGKRNRDLQLVYKKEFNNRSEAKKLESFLKRQKSRLFIEKFISGKIIIPL
ncbi:MAG: GIY-YIG nuclease family protein [Candidatus Omnitrophica bacterium]|nr:GIY-YIG nuclease family protein [Candidatus Omnitrophota bacterium]